MGKRYYWLKLHDDFFNSKRIKKLRRLAGGDTYTIIYLKMQLLAIKNDGVITYTGLETSFADELALDIDENADDVAVTLSYLLNSGLAETDDNIVFFFPWAVANTGSEATSTIRSRECRARQKELAQKSAQLLPESDEIHNEALQCNKTQHFCNGEIEKEKEIEKEIENKPAEPKYSEAFTKFWEHYPKKKGKYAAFTEFKKIKGVSVDTLINAVEKQKQSDQWQRDNGQYIPEPERWLKKRRWDDVVDVNETVYESAELPESIIRRG